ncbi:branched-chain amino acid ABC transporter permease [Micromonospora sp. NPDC048999]|uniref:branched-chain amino acid ABC transporter permease n=1 Tax=Micromonospora sp. NPDC048999 TaxID=3155391 RepID=UPI0033C12A04
MSAFTHARTSDRIRLLLRRVLPWSAPVLAALGIAAVVAWPDTYLHATAARMFPLALLAVSVCVVTGHAGLPTLGQVAPYAAGAYTTAHLALHGVADAALHLLAAAAAGAMVAALVGVVLARYRGTVVLMLSLAVAELTTITASQWRTVSGGTDGLAGIPAPRLLPGLPPLLDDRAVLLYAAAVAATATAVAMRLLGGNRQLLLSAVRGNEARAAASGHRVTTYLWVVHAGAGAVAGIGGALLIHTHRWITPADVGFTSAALALLAVVIGGTASLPGAVVGAVMVLGVRDVVAVDLPGHAPLLLGALFVAAVYLLPGGLTALPARLRRSLRVLRPPANGPDTTAPHMSRRTS